MNPLLDKVRQFLKDGLSDDLFLDLCQDHFPDVYQQFTTGQTRSHRIRLLIEWVHTQREFPALYAAARVASPKAFAQFEASLDTPREQPEGPPPPCCLPCDVLILSANPRETPTLDLRDEAEAIRAALQEGREGKAWRVCWEEATQSERVTELLLSGDPRILHFGGHGNEDGELLFQDADRFQHPVTLESVAKFLAARPGRLECIFLNACFSHERAHVLTERGRCVVSMSREIDAVTSRRFAKIFYQCLGDGLKYRPAFDAALADGDIVKLAGAKVPRFIDVASMSEALGRTSTVAQPNVAPGSEIPPPERFINALCQLSESQFRETVLVVGVSEADLGGADRRGRAVSLYQLIDRPGTKRVPNLLRLRSEIASRYPDAFTGD